MGRRTEIYLTSLVKYIGRSRKITGYAEFIGTRLADKLIRCGLRFAGSLPRADTLA
jgi:hypothetical protein